VRSTQNEIQLRCILHEGFHVIEPELKSAVVLAGGVVFISVALSLADDVKRCAVGGRSIAVRLIVAGL